MSVAAKDVWIVIAAFNESTRISRTVASVVSHGWNVVVVDDGSRDNTGEMARKAGAVVLSHMINRGQGAALQTGLDFATAQDAKFIVTFDADGQHQASDIPGMIELIASQRHDVVLGSRFLGNTVNMPLHRRCLLTAAVWFTRLTTRLTLTDTHNGLRALSASAARKIRLQEDRMAHASEILHLIATLRLRYIEFPVTVHYHDETLAKGQRSRDAWGVLGRLVVARLFT